MTPREAAVAALAEALPRAIGGVNGGWVGIEPDDPATREQAAAILDALTAEQKAALAAWLVPAADARIRGYREGRLAVWQELAEYVQEAETIAERIVAESDGPLPTADEVRGILRAPEPVR